MVTCQKQPALGCVFKLVEVNNKPCIKLSEDVQKVTFPGKKNAYRIYDKDDIPLVDLLTTADEPAPQVGEAFLCRHPFIVSFDNKLIKILFSITQTFFISYLAT